MYSAMEKRGASTETRTLVHVVLDSALKQALKWDLVVRNVCDAVDPTTRKREITPLDASQVATLISATNDRLEALYVPRSDRLAAWRTCSACSGPTWISTPAQFPCGTR